MRRHLFCIATLLSLNAGLVADTIAAPVAAPTQAAFQPFTGRVTGQRVRLRAGYEGDSAIIKEVNRGDLLIIEGEKHDFYAVHPPKGTKGYIFRSYVLDNVVEGSRVNVRLSPDLDAPIIGQLQAGTRVEGQPCASNPKWLEIVPSEGVHFYVAKKFVEHAGDVNFLTQCDQRRQEVNHLLNSAYLIGQGELRKSFPEINLAKIHEGFDRILTEYQEFPEQVARAQEAKKLIQETYLQKQIAYLETQAKQSSDQMAARNAALTAELANYQDRLQELETALNEQREQAHAAMLAYDAASEETTVAAPHVTGSPTLAPATTHPLVTTLPMTDQMRHWQPAEDALFAQWSEENETGSEETFYADQRLSGEILHGVVHHFDRAVKNPPGDYILMRNNRTLAYLYSTQVNLDTLVGKEVTLLGSPRDNHHFAFPAYFVLKAE